MKYILILLMSMNIVFANGIELNSFEADFTQTVTNDKGNSLEYRGTMSATKPQYMLWSYTFPAKKDIIINATNVTVIEYDIEQVQIRKIDRDFDFFSIIKNAKKIKPNVYIAIFNEIKYTINLQNSQIVSIEYFDALENKINIVFKKQIQNKEVDLKKFTPKIPLDFDIIRA